MKRTTSKKTCFYEVLNISKTATADEVKRSYRVLALKWHPDKNPDDIAIAEEKFKEIGEAYSVLSNPDSRLKYDKYGHEGLDNNFGDFEGAADLFFSFFEDGSQNGFLNPDELAFLMAASAKGAGSRRRRAGRKGRGAPTMGGMGAMGGMGKGMDKMMEAMMMSMMFGGPGGKGMGSMEEMFGMAGVPEMDDMDDILFAEMAGFGGMKGKASKKKAKKAADSDDDWEDDDDDGKGPKQIKATGGDNDWEDD